MTTLTGLHPTLMRPRVEALLADPEAQAMGVTVVSAFRSNERQADLFAAAVKKYGSEKAARKWVAPPGKSNHGPRVDGFGTAVDFGIRGVRAVKGQWPEHLVTKFDAIARRHGLYSPMEWEDWHFEPIKNWQQEDDMTPDQDNRLKRIEDAVLALADEVHAVKESVAGRGKVTAGKVTPSLLGRVESDVTAIKRAVVKP